MLLSAVLLLYNDGGNGVGSNILEDDGREEAEGEDEEGEVEREFCRLVR